MVRNTHGLGQKQSKLIKSVTSCDGHLILNNPLCLGKYLSKSFKTLKEETAREYAKHL